MCPILDTQYEDLKGLRNQQESILRDKIELVQGQIDQYNTMLAKLGGSENESKMKLVGEIESKIVKLQTQLQALNEEKENPSASAAGMASTPTRKGYPSYHSGGRWARVGGGRARGGRFSGRGRGRGRGFGRGGGVNMESNGDDAMATEEGAEEI